MSPLSAEFLKVKNFFLMVSKGSFRMDRSFGSNISMGLEGFLHKIQSCSTTSYKIKIYIYLYINQFSSRKEWITNG